MQVNQLPNPSFVFGSINCIISYYNANFLFHCVSNWTILASILRTKRCSGLSAAQFTVRFLLKPYRIVKEALEPKAGKQKTLLCCVFESRTNRFLPDSHSVTRDGEKHRDVSDVVPNSMSKNNTDNLSWHLINRWKYGHWLQKRCNTEVIQTIVSF